MEFHQIDRKTHERVHHQNVDERGEVERADIVKGFEYAKGKYIEIDPPELKAQQLQTATTMPIKQFVKAEELPPSYLKGRTSLLPKMTSRQKLSVLCVRLWHRRIHWELERAPLVGGSIWWRSALPNARQEGPDVVSAPL